VICRSWPKWRSTFDAEYEGGCLAHGSSLDANPLLGQLPARHWLLGFQKIKVIFRKPLKLGRKGNGIAVDRKVSRMSFAVLLMRKGSAVFVANKTQRERESAGNEEGRFC
jgi:hypothetical protein